MSRVAIVTGAAQGLGRAIAVRLAEDGLDVVLNDIPAKEASLKEVEEIVLGKGRKALVITGDCASEEDVKNLVETAAERLGGVDVMVANAGVSLLNSVTEMTVEEWDRVMSINVRGVYLCYRYAALQMVKQGRGGRILGASSVCGKQGFANLGAYVASKFAVRGLTQTAALELGPHKITVNAYAPGLIETPMTAGLNGSSEHFEQTRQALRMPAHTRTGKPEDIASLVSYLVKPEAHFITGQSVIADGGWLFD